MKDIEGDSSMFERKKINQLKDFFLDLKSRSEQGVYFYRIAGYNQQIDDFILEYYEEARKTGVVIEGKIPNPDKKNLQYYEEIMGLEFQMDATFIRERLGRWLPRMNDYQKNSVATAIYATLDALRKSGKNDNMLKNAYIKFMCWLYYKFERVVVHMGEDKVPKILYEGTVSNYELLLLSVLSGAGCDVVLLEYQGEEDYKILDPANEKSDLLVMPDMKSFPQGYSLKKVRQDIQDAMKQRQLYGTPPALLNCTNAWISGKGFEDIRMSIPNRGADPNLFYNCFYRIKGVEDKLTYLNELYQLQLELKNSHRKVVIVEQEFSKPTPDEIGKISRGNYVNQEQMIGGLVSNIVCDGNQELQKIIRKAFIDVMILSSKKENINLNKLTNKAIYLLCWFKRYQSQLFQGWNNHEIASLFYLGAVKTEAEFMFLQMLARTPVDVVLLEPNRNEESNFEDPLLYQIVFTDTLVVNKFPRENGDIRIGTAAYHAERDLDGMLYQDVGIYRPQQYAKANTVRLQTMYEEIEILWKEEVKYRPNFSVVDGVVNIPTIFAKISGVKDGDVDGYWKGVNKLLGEDTLLIKQIPNVEPTQPNPARAHAAEFFRNGKVQKRKIKEHSCYTYHVLREEIQDYMLDKAQCLIEQKWIKGTFETGTEYAIIATILNLDKEILRLIQSFDFTKKNPKVIYVCRDERILSMEDTIIASFLNMMGFDILFFVPTGYQVVEKYFNEKKMEEYQIGEYKYDLQVPDFNKNSQKKSRLSWRDKLFRRGVGKWD